MCIYPSLSLSPSLCMVSTFPFACLHLAAQRLAAPSSLGLGQIAQMPTLHLTPCPVLSVDLPSDPGPPTCCRSAHGGIPLERQLGPWGPEAFRGSRPRTSSLGRLYQVHVQKVQKFVVPSGVLLLVKKKQWWLTIPGVFSLAGFQGRGNMLLQAQVWSCQISMPSISLYTYIYTHVIYTYSMCIRYAYSFTYMLSICTSSVYIYSYRHETH